MPKEKNYKYLIKTKYKDAKFMYGLYLVTKQQVGALVMKLGRFFF